MTYEFARLLERIAALRSEVVVLSNASGQAELVQVAAGAVQATANTGPLASSAVAQLTSHGDSAMGSQALLKLLEEAKQALRGLE